MAKCVGTLLCYVLLISACHMLVITPADSASRGQMSLGVNTSSLINSNKSSIPNNKYTLSSFSDEQPCDDNGRVRAANDPEGSNDKERSFMERKLSREQLGMRVNLLHRDAFPQATNNIGQGADAKDESVQWARLKEVVKRSHHRAKYLSSLSAAFFVEEAANNGPTPQIAPSATTQTDLINNPPTSSPGPASLPSSDFNGFTSPVAPAPGEFVLQIQLGTPPQNFTAVMDTGSDLIWTICEPCSTCNGPQQPSFNPAASSSYTTVQCQDVVCNALDVSNLNSCTPDCQYLYSYGDGSYIAGDLSLETMTLSSFNGTNENVLGLAFGCSHTVRGLFAGAGGLAGFGLGALSLIQQLGPNINNRFAYCLVSFEDSATVHSPLFLGGIAALNGPGAGITPIVVGDMPSYYYVSMQGIELNGIPLNISNSSFDPSVMGGTIFDSGTTLTYIEPTAFSILSLAFQRAIPLPVATGNDTGAFSLCFDTTNVNLSTIEIPSLTLNFDNADMTPPPDNYFVLYQNLLCLMINPVPNSLPTAIIGNRMQQNFVVLYDVGQMQISFMPQACDKL